MPPQTPDAASMFRSLSLDKQNEYFERMSPEEKKQLLSALNASQPSAAPAPKSDYKSVLSPEGQHPILSKALEYIPAVTATAGSIAASESGPGAIAAAAGSGYLGKRIEQGIRNKLGWDTPDQGTRGEAAIEGIKQGAYELGGRLLGPVIGKGMNLAGRKVPTEILERYPVLKDVFAIGPNKAVQHLTSAAAEKGTTASDVALQSIGNTIGDIEQELGKLPAKDQTVDGFLKAVNSRKDAMNLESGTAMLPIAGQKTVPVGISDRIKGLIRSYMAQTPAGSAERKYIVKRAAEFEKPWSYRQLDELRTDLASQLSKHQAKESVAKYTAEKGDLNLAIDNAIQDGLRDTVYPTMDRAAGKPPGYFADLKGRQSNLIRLQSVLNQRVKRLKSSQAINEAAPLFSHENVSVYARPTGLPRTYIHGINNALFPPREYAAASKHVAKAFRPSVNSLPYQILLSGGFRVSDVGLPAPYSQQATPNDTVAPPAPRQHPTDAWADPANLNPIAP